MLQIAAVFALIAVNPAPAWVDVLVYLAVAATVISGADYFFGLRRRIEEEREARTRHVAARKPSAQAAGASSHSRIVVWRRWCSPASSSRRRSPSVP